MSPDLITADPAATRLRRVGRLARRRMRIDAPDLTNGFHSDGTLTVEITGLGSPVAGIPDSFEWEADRPIALVVVRSGIDGEDVEFSVGPSRRGVGRGASVGDGTGIRYIAFCYDAAPDSVLRPATRDREGAAAPAGPPVDDLEPAARRRLAASSAFRPTGRDRRSILGLLLGSNVRRATI
jgi:hypothetical protein